MFFFFSKIRPVAFQWTVFLARLLARCWLMNGKFVGQMFAHVWPECGAQEILISYHGHRSKAVWVRTYGSLHQTIFWHLLFVKQFNAIISQIPQTSKVYKLSIWPHTLCFFVELFMTYAIHAFFRFCVFIRSTRSLITLAHGVCSWARAQQWLYMLCYCFLRIRSNYYPCGFWEGSENSGLGTPDLV